jgi:SNF2 family DNA or RNA helicase
MCHAMGTGKTLTSIAAIVASRAIGELKPCIVVCPLATIHTVWKNTFKKYTTLNIGVYDKSSIDADSMLGKDVILVTYSTLMVFFHKGWIYEDNKWQQLTHVESFIELEGGWRRKRRPDDPVIHIPNKPLFYHMAYSVAIFDEAHNFRNGSDTNVTHRAVYTLSKLCDVRIAATGTIIHNAVSDVASMLHGLNVKDDLADVDSWVRNGVDESIRIKAIEEFHERFLHRVTDAILKDKIPPIKHYEHIILKPFPPSMHMEIDRYNDMLTIAQRMASDSMFVHYDDDGNVEKLNVLMLRLSQMLISPYYTPPKIVPAMGAENMAYIRNNPTNKMKEMKELIESLLTKPRYEDNSPHKKLIVVSHHVKMLHICKATYNKPSLMYDGSLDPDKRSEVIETFLREGGPKVLFLSLKAGGEGIHVVSEHGPTAMIFVQNWFSHAAHKQCEKRIHRIGQTREVDIYYMMVQGTLDQEIYKLHDTKNTLARAIEDSDIDETNELFLWKERSKLITDCIKAVP